jgi:hypothetical protein
MHYPTIASRGGVFADKEWRMDHLYAIKTKRKRLEPMRLNDAQRDYLKRRRMFNFVLKARQLGFSTFCLLDMLDDTINTPNMNSAIVAHEKQKVVKLFEIIKRGFENIPEHMRPRVSIENRNELYFPDLDSKIFVTVDTRGETVHNLHVSELAFISHADEKLAATLESVPKNGKITFETTANGMVGYAFDEWVSDEFEGKKFFYNWMWDPQYRLKTSKTIEELKEEYRPLALRYGCMLDLADRFKLDAEQLAFYLAKMRRHKELVVQEYPTTDLEAFLSSGRSIFHAQDIAKHHPAPPVERKWGDLLVYEPPLLGFNYTVGVDTSEGGGGDNATICVLNVQTGVQVAEYANPNIQPADLGKLAIEVCKWYNRALMVPEINNTGIAFMDYVKTKYGNIYKREVIDKRSRETTEALGWRTTAVTKPRLVFALEEAVRDEAINIRSAELLKELRTFVKPEDSSKHGYGAEGTNHDDRVIAIGLALQGLKFTQRTKKPENVAEKRLKEYIAGKSLDTYFGTEKPFGLTNADRRKRYSIRSNPQSTE